MAATIEGVQDYEDLYLLLCIEEGSWTPAFLMQTKAVFHELSKKLGEIPDFLRNFKEWWEALDVIDQPLTSQTGGSFEQFFDVKLVHSEANPRFDTEKKLYTVNFKNLQTLDDPLGTMEAALSQMMAPMKHGPNDRIGITINHPGLTNPITIRVQKNLTPLIVIEYIGAVMGSNDYIGAVMGSNDELTLNEEFHFSIVCVY